ncbi:MAG TPA: methyltransferase domain-containing protein [Vicinamibacterales bacterium]|jgi:ubiquinone/menaquinone biosynthesis C-methylase UbiE|nr:methyltransferase domain-containing protein [Vicinamibacterales bacterium]
MRVIAVSVALIIVAGVFVEAQRRHPVSGRIFAPVMGVGGAGWLERPEREDEEAPSKALDALELKPGMVVADIGAGSGYYSSRIAKRVGPTGRVYATDIQQGMIDILDRRITAEGLTNVTTVLGGMDDPRLPPASIDLAIMVDVYHELQQPQLFLQRLKGTFKPNGRLVLLEFRKEDPKVPILEVHKMSVAEVKQEMEAEGFVLDKVIDVLPWQHIIVLRVK